ncbi:MAG: carbamoyl-phosphate synthase large subunit [Alphaproteobacteria bacterium]|nr:carbamoyl-phosphate synthase large subunit [Alphaproteobacteria bacterium]
MSKRTDIKSIMIIGAGPIVIGQACEFDYSGVQACKALKDEGYRVILVNSNPATIMTDSNLADATYIEPITPEVVSKILSKEKPDALLATMGGQTALNTAMDLYKKGILAELDVELIGARADSIDKAEDRLKFRETMKQIGLETPKSELVSNMEQAHQAFKTIGLPLIIRPSFTLAGTGSGVAYTLEEYENIVSQGLILSPVGQVLVEESVLGWKEYEMEVVRDSADNCIIVCSIENVDPMGVHTGDSITVAPALTLTDKEYQRMRQASIAVLRAIGVDTGGSNVQFAVNPKDGRMIVIEMNPRVSRSSALASKATGFPIAKIAAKLAVGYTLDELQNDITKVTPASFEPTIDYVVTKIPRFAFEKFPAASKTLTTSMKSVGEVMAIGRSFAESIQKALCSLETNLTGFDNIDFPSHWQNQDWLNVLSTPFPDRILWIAQAIRENVSLQDIMKVTGFDPWFINQIADIIDAEKIIIQNGLPKESNKLYHLKSMGFSDERLAYLTNLSAEQVRQHRFNLKVHPVFKRIDTCSGEFISTTSYMYSTYSLPHNQTIDNEAYPSDKSKVIILGSGPNRIGQGIEFDYCCVHAAFGLNEIGIETIMVNCNPETVSTDYDTTDRLYFEPLSAEYVLEIARIEQSKGDLKGIIVQFGGQTPLKLAGILEKYRFPILGTTPKTIDLTEDRALFQEFLSKRTERYLQPQNALATSLKQAEEAVKYVGYPIMIRPSYVLGGRAMEIVYDHESLVRYMKEAVKISNNNPILIDSYLENAIEVDVDVLSDGRDVYIAGIMEHIEEAGIHSGDSACSLPPYSLADEMIDKIKNQSRQLALDLGVVGLMNIQFAIKDQKLYILEVNPRASRTIPFVAKATGYPIAKIAVQIMAGKSLASYKLDDKVIRKHVAVKEVVFPFNRFPGVDIVLGPEMKSTGEVMGLDKDFASAFAKSQIATGLVLPLSGTVLISVRDRDKEAFLLLAKKIIMLGFDIMATQGTADYLAKHNIEVTVIKKVFEGSPHTLEAMKSGKIKLVFNTVEGIKAKNDSLDLRRIALSDNIPYYTTIAGANAAIQAIATLKKGDLDVASLQSYFK